MKRIKIVVLLATLLMASGCADSVDFVKAANMSPVGFWYGLWHGMIVPFAWVVSLFSDSTAIYAIYNNGGWYDFGFILGIGGLTGGASGSRQSGTLTIRKNSFFNKI